MGRTKGKITYQQFITKYKNTEEEKREELVKEQIITSYVTYQEKLGDVKAIVDIGNHDTVPNPTEDGEVTIFRRNTPIMYYFWKIKMIDRYTNIKVEDGKELEMYNALEELGLVDELLQSIPVMELKKYSELIEMVNDDLYMNERDIPSFFETKVDALGLVLNTLLSSLGELGKAAEDVNLQAIDDGK